MICRTFRTEDDVLNLLMHLGYLSYDYENKTVKNTKQSSA